MTATIFKYDATTTMTMLTIIGRSACVEKYVVTCWYYMHKRTWHNNVYHDNCCFFFISFLEL